MKKLLLIVPSLLIIFLFSGCSQNLATSSTRRVYKTQANNATINSASNQNSNYNGTVSNTSSSMSNIDNSMDKLNNELTNGSNETESLINNIN